MALHGAKGEILFQKRTSPFGTPKRKAGGVSTSPPAPPNDQKGGATPLPFWIILPVVLPVRTVPASDDAVSIMPAEAALLRPPHNKKRPQWRSFYFNSCSRSWKYSGQKNSSTVIFRPSQSFLTVATVVVWFRPLIMLLSVDCVTPLRMLKRLIVILRSSHSAKMRRRTASPTVITTTPLSFHKEYRFPLEKINSFGLK